MRRHRSPAMAVALAALAALLAACDGGGDAPTGGAPRTIEKPSPSGDNQSAAAGAQLTVPLRVLVQRGGVPEEGVTVTWSVAAGGGSVSPASSSTNAGGIASTRWTLGASGAQRVQASVAGATGSPQTFNATIVGASPGASAPAPGDGGHH